MVRDWIQDPFVASQAVRQPYGHNHESALKDGLLATFGELLVLYLLVPAWTANDSVWRAAVALILFAALVPFAAMLSMHTGGILMLHLCWAIVITLVLFALTVTRMTARVAASIRKQ